MRANTVGPGTYSVTPGSAAVLGFDDYPCADISIAPGPTEAADSTASTLRSDGWNPGTPIVDQYSMTASQFTANMGVNALFYFGHGDTGVVAFPGICNGTGNPPYQLPYYWGVGDIANNNSKAVGSPSGSNLYWMFLFSSDTVAPDAVQDPADANSGVIENMQYVSNPWEPLFYQANLPLRGLYGYWQSPGSCLSQGLGSRNCDVTSDNNPTVSATLLMELDTGGLSSGLAPVLWTP